MNEHSRFWLLLGVERKVQLQKNDDSQTYCLRFSPFFCPFVHYCFSSAVSSTRSKRPSFFSSVYDSLFITHITTIHELRLSVCSRFADTVDCIAPMQNMFSRDVKRLSFRCQTLKFSRPNVKCSA